MPAATPVYALPYPVPADSADVPADLQALANRIEAVVGPGSADGQGPVWDNTAKKWVAGSAGSMVKLVDQTLGAAAATIDLPGIAQTFRTLQLVAMLRADNAASAVVCQVRYNGLTDALYDSYSLTGAG